MPTRDRMIGHLISQFQNAPNITAILDAVGAELEPLFQAMDDLEKKRWIDTASGRQLDGLGEIVGKNRRIENAVQMAFFGFYGMPNSLGFEEGRFRDTWEDFLSSVDLLDDNYRLVLKQKIWKNNFQGTTEETLQSLKFIFSAPVVIVTELGNAKFAVGIGRRFTWNDFQLAKAYNLFVKAAGVGVVWQAIFDADGSFGFLGQPGIKGFEKGTFADTFDVPNI